MDLKKITHFIFDLGGVIINIDPMLTIRALQENSPIDTAFKDLSHPLHLAYEKGEISGQVFRNELSKITGVPIEKIDYCWNALLQDVPQQRVALIVKLRQKYPLYLLSNTNDIHIPAVHQIFERETGIRHLDELFDKVYLSYEMGKRKPEMACFEQVIEENALNPSTTLFIDDSESNIEGARNVGLQTLHIQAPFTINHHLDALVS